MQASSAPQELAAIPLSSADLEFLLGAASYHRAGAEAAELALQRSETESVRQLARDMLQEHRAAAARLRDIAAANDVALRRGVTHEQRLVLGGLRGLRGAAFDRDFLQRAAIAEQRELIALLHQQATAPGRDPRLAEFARDMLERLHPQLAAAQSLHAGMASRRDARAAMDDGARELSSARQLVRQAAGVVRQMKSEPELAPMLRRAQGVFILPAYGRAAVGLGVQGGEGVLVTRDGERFGNPVFYRMSGISIGPQAGAAAGDLAFLLLTERAVQQFRSGRAFSLNADGTLTLGDASGRGHAATGKLEDVLVWSGTQGLYAGLSVGATRITVNDQANRAYYGSLDATPLAILGNRVENPHRNVLAAVLGT